MSSALKAFVIGATGQCGKAITKELAKTSEFTGVTLFTRRQLDLPPSDNEHDYSKVDQKIVNFDRLAEDHSSEFTGYDIGFGCLGLSVMVASEEEVMKVEHGYTLAAAQLAKAGGCKQFAVITGGAKKDSMISTYRIKALIEDDLQKLGFDQLTIVRPGGLVGGEKVGATTSQKIFTQIAEPLDVGRFITCEVPVLAKVLVHKVLQPGSSPVEIIGNRDVHKLGQELDGKKKGCAITRAFSSS